MRKKQSINFFHKSINKSKNIQFWKKIISNNINLKAIIHKCIKFQGNIFKNKNLLTFLWTTMTTTTEFPYLHRALLYKLNKNET